MTERWDLDALDRAADRARVWAWFPLVVIGLTLLGYVGSVVVAISVALMGAMPALLVVAVVIPAFLPLLVGLGVHVWRTRDAARHLPGPPLTSWEHAARFALVLGVLLPLAAALWGLGPNDDALLPVFGAISLGGLASIGLLFPTGGWSPPRGARVAQAAAVGLPPVLVALAVSWRPVAPWISAAAIAAPLLVVGFLTRRRVLALYALRGEGRHEEAVAALTTWRAVGAAPVMRAAVLFHAGRVEAALDLCIERARRVPRPHWAPTLLIAAECARLLGRTDQAAELTDALLAIAPDRPEGYFAAASLALDADAPPDRCLALLDRAATHVERGNTLGGTSALARAGLAAWRVRLGLLRAAALARAGQSVDATRELDAALAAVDHADRPTAARLLFESLRAQRALGRDEAATRALIHELDPAGIGGWLLRSLGSPG